MFLWAKVRQSQWHILSPRVGQVTFDEFADPQTFVQLSHVDQANVGDDPRSLKIDLQRGIERKLCGLVLFST